MSAIVVVFVAPFAQAMVSEYGERKKRKKAELEGQLTQILSGTLILLVDAAHVDWKKTGLQVFRVRSWWLFWQFQARVAKLRLAHIPPSGIRWRKGKGLIGRCWKQMAPVSKNLHTHFAQYRNISEFHWKGLSEDASFGLEYSEFKKIGDKYGLVVAFPLTSGEKYIGCVTADMPPDCSSDVNEAKIRETLSGAAVSISAVLAGEKP